MRVKCEYCHGEMDDKSPYCPNCGAPNHNIHQTVDGTPKTIEELKQWYIKRNLPPAETTRFFIGVDYKKPKAFGIYKDSNTGEFIVYKNKGRERMDVIKKKFGPLANFEFDKLFLGQVFF